MLFRSFQAIVAGVQRIALSPEATITGVEEEFHWLSLETPCSSISEHTSSPISHSPTSNQRPTKSSSSKAEWSQHTKTVLAQLSHIESNILSSANDLIGIPSPEKITEINQLVTTWHKALALINRDLPVIKTRKTAVMEVLRCLEALLSEVNIISLSNQIGRASCRERVCR